MILFLYNNKCKEQNTTYEKEKTLWQYQKNGVAQLEK